MHHRILELFASAVLSFAGTPPNVHGSFIANGVPSKLAYARTMSGQEFSGDKTVVLVLSEKDAVVGKEPFFDTDIGTFANSLVVTIVLKNGDIISSKMKHAAFKGHDNVGGVGLIYAEQIQVHDGRIRGHLTTNGNMELFGETFSADLHFDAAMP